MAEKLHTTEQVTSFLQELKIQTDRGAAVIAAAVLDEILQMLLLARFVEIGSERRDTLFTKIGAPLSPLSAKIELAFATGIISNNARLAAHIVRDVRNKFAHRIEALTFDHPEVVRDYRNTLFAKRKECVPFE
jgi:Kef-type K+ transport system membrane component KefB